MTFEVVKKKNDFLFTLKFDKQDLIKKTFFFLDDNVALSTFLKNREIIYFIWQQYSFCLRGTQSMCTNISW